MANQSDSLLYRYMPLKVIGVFLLCIISSGCYITDISLHRSTALVQPLPKSFVIHSGDHSPLALSPLYIGVSDSRLYEIKSHDKIETISFEAFDLRNGLYWAEATTFNKNGTKEYVSFLVKKNKRILTVYQPADSPRKFESRGNLLSAYGNKDVLNAPTVTYTVYDMENTEQRTVALRQIEKMGKTEKKKEQKSKASISTEDKKQLERTSWIYDAPKKNGARKQYLYNFAHSSLGNNTKPFMRIECNSDGVDVAIMWGKQMKGMYPSSSNQDAVWVKAKFGQGEWSDLGWSVSRDRLATFPSTTFNAIGSGIDSAIFSLLGMKSTSKRNSEMFNWTASSFVNQIKSLDSSSDQQSTLYLSAQGLDRQQVRLEVDLSGYNMLVKKHFSRHCQ